MTVPRIYQNRPLSVGQSIILSDSARNHCAQVLRLREGDLLHVFNGVGGEFAATITQLNRRDLVVKLDKFIELDHESPLRLHLAQGISRGERMDLVIQKATELGVASLTPLITERCNVRLDDTRWERRLSHWQGIINSACEQSARVYLPSLHRPQSFDEFLSNTPTGILLYHKADVDLATYRSPPPGSMLSLLIGPEGGLSQKEIDSAQKKGWQAISLGPRILRTETAALAALSVLQYLYGDFVKR